MTHRDDRETRTTLYRSRSGMCCGVCKGIAEYYSFDVFWTRVLTVIAAIFAGIWPAVIMYVVAAMVMKLEPVMPFESEEDEEFYHSYSGSRSMALQRLKRTFDNLDRRIQRLESTVTTRDYDWEERLNS
ncbi:MAG: envelope stress response membrane protein PspC [Candidatus Hydrogenedentes bacterium]|nr:envelope stress response membrane protein PspC [Candidatus Hydrogenedentota bacterium]